MKIKSDVELNCLTRKYPAYFTDFEETKHYFTTKSEFLKIEWLVSATSGISSLGLYKTKVDERYGLMACWLTYPFPRNYVIGWFDYPPDFLPDWEDGKSSVKGIYPNLLQRISVKLKWTLRDIKAMLCGCDESCYEINGLTRQCWKQNEHSLKHDRLMILSRLGKFLNNKNRPLLEKVRQEEMKKIYDSYDQSKDEK